MAWKNLPIMLSIMAFLTYHSCNQTESRIMHGNTMKIQEAPWTIALVSAIQKPGEIEYVVGSGAILSKNYVISTGHTFLPDKGYITNDKLNTVIRYAVSTLEVSDGMYEVITDIQIHRSLKSGDLKYAKYDIAILKCERPMEMGPRTAVAKTISNPSDTYGIGSTCILTGYGLSGYEEIDKRPARLRTTDMVIHDRKKCAEYVPIGENLICAYHGNAGPCNADSGAPLICGANLYAIHIRGMLCDKGYEIIIGQYLPLSSHYKFIKNRTNGEAAWNMPF